ncbi:6900_t:CDS:2 [Funneliformis geosporum]|uniref:6900_t:CDS:1 n=1 Tax=Funneliformis geosporum TaxID=1117311 RepID=A0A9W4SZ07_9GLOM|nr:6900_t:CDS:2 [Funneliformis geosporum]
MVEWKSTLQWKKCKYSSFVRVQSPFLREVIVRGDITGLDYDEMSECIKAITKFNFVHVQKKEDKEKASQFYYNMMKKRFYYDDNKERGLIHFYDATYYNSTQKVVYKMDTETANTGTSTSVLSRVEISDHNNINENERSKKRKITEKRKSPESPVSVVYVLYEDNHIFNIALHTPGIRNKADLLVSSVSDKLIIIEKNFRPFKAEVELPSGIKTISVKIEIEHGVSTVTLEKSKKVFEII